MSDIVVSNGFGQFHLRGLAEALEHSGELRMYISGATPPRWVTGEFGPPALRRWIERGLDASPDRVVSMNVAEVANQVAQRLRSSGRFAAADRMSELSLTLYERRASRAILGRADRGAVYHVRAGYGGASIRTAREKGLAIVCDHSIVAPGVIDEYVPQAPPRTLMPRMWKRIESDIAAADGVVVNSQFVADTFGESGYDTSRVYVAYTPVDESFARLLDASAMPRSGIPTVTFAGTAEYRKGIDSVVETINFLGESSPVRWRIVGDWSADAVDLRARLPQRVEVIPKVARAQLARVLGETDVFFFPTRAEGSARVVAEALRAGCQVVTTRMSGSAMRPGVDGATFDRPDDIEGFSSAIMRLAQRSDREREEAAARTRAFAAERLSPRRYVADVRRAYEALGQGI